MKTLRGQELDTLLTIDDALVKRIRLMSAEGNSLGVLIQFLADRGTPKAGTSIALRRAGIATGHEIKNAVHVHPAYADRRAADEAFYDAAAEFVERNGENATAA